MKGLLITGGTGFFGRALLRYLDSVERLTGRLPFDHVTVLSRSPEEFRRRYPRLGSFPWLRWHTGDILLPDTLPYKARYHSILHAAADSTSASGMSHLQTFHQIVRGTENVLQLAVKSGAKRFLFTSSGGVYGPQPVEMENIPETHHSIPDPLNIFNSYGVAKRQGEHLCALYGAQFGIEMVVARCFAFVGRDLDWDAHFAIGNFIRDALERPNITVNGNGSPLRSYLDQHDLAHWLLTLLENGKAANAYNVGSDVVISILDLANLVRDILAPGKPVDILTEPRADNRQRSRYIPDINKAKSELNLNVTISLEAAIENCIR